MYFQRCRRTYAWDDHLHVCSSGFTETQLKKYRLVEAWKKWDIRKCTINITTLRFYHEILLIVEWYDSIWFLGTELLILVINSRKLYNSSKSCTLAQGLQMAAVISRLASKLSKENGYNLQNQQFSDKGNINNEYIRNTTI